MKGLWHDNDEVDDYDEDSDETEQKGEPRRSAAPQHQPNLPSPRGRIVDNSAHKQAEVAAREGRQSLGRQNENRGERLSADAGNDVRAASGDISSYQLDLENEIVFWAGSYFHEILSLGDDEEITVTLRRVPGQNGWRKFEAVGVELDRAIATPAGGPAKGPAPGRSIARRGPRGAPITKARNLGPAKKPVPGRGGRLQR